MLFCLAYMHPGVFVTGQGIHQSSAGPWHWKYFVRSPCPITMGLRTLQITCSCFDGRVQENGRGTTPSQCLNCAGGSCGVLGFMLKKIPRFPLPPCWSIACLGSTKIWNQLHGCSQHLCTSWGHAWAKEKHAVIVNRWLNMQKCSPKMKQHSSRGKPCV